MLKGIIEKKKMMQKNAKTNNTCSMCQLFTSGYVILTYITLSFQVENIYVIDIIDKKGWNIHFYFIFSFVQYSLKM